MTPVNAVLANQGSRGFNKSFKSGLYGTHFVFAQDGVQRQGPPMTFSVIFEKPNRFRIARLEPRLEKDSLAVVVASDGEQLEASLSQLEPQRLITKAPERATLESVA